MLTFLSILTFIGAALGVLSLVFSFIGGAQQVAAGAGVAVALVVIPYCITKLVWMDEQRKDTKAILAALKGKPPTPATQPADAHVA